MARLTLILGVLATVVYLLDGFRFMLNEWRTWRNKGKWIVAIMLCIVPVSAWAEDLYVGQSDAGAANGTNCANQHSAAWFNTAANWGGGAGEIDPGDTAHFCGAISTALLTQLNGTAGNLITLYFETGASLSAPVCGNSGCLKLEGRSYYVVDGGVNGIIESTNNGSAPTYANQSTGKGIDAWVCSHCEIKNLTIRNIYVHEVDVPTVMGNTFSSVGTTVTSVAHGAVANQLIQVTSGAQSGETHMIQSITNADVLVIAETFTVNQTNQSWSRIVSDRALDYSLSNAIRFSGTDVHIHHNTITHAGWALFDQYGVGDGMIEIDHNSISHSSHGWTAAGVSLNATNTVVSFHDNHLFDFSNWDTTPLNAQSPYHHDGIHLYGTVALADAGDQYDIYNNRFDGACGATMTAHIFMESAAGSRWTVTGTSRTFNNVSICNSSNQVFGLVQTAGGTAKTYNNTIVGPGSSGSVCYGVGISVNTAVKNMAITDCRILSSLAATSTFAVPSDMNYNAYDCNGSTNCFYWEGIAEFKTFAQWISLCGGCDLNATDNASLLLNGDGSPQAGSPLLATGENLTSLGITALNSDINGVARPTSGPWDIGAIQSTTTTQSPAVIARIIRYMEVAAFVTGMGWHFRKQVMAVSLAAIAGGSTVYQLAPRSYDTVKTVSKDSAVKVLTVFNDLTKPRS